MKIDGKFEKEIENNGWKLSDGDQSRTRDNEDVVLPSLISPADTNAFNVEGIQTVIRKTLVGFSQESRETEILLRGELERYKVENKQLKNAIKEASRLNLQWRHYHDQRHGYVQKLRGTIQELRKKASSTQAGGIPNLELLKLKDTLGSQQKDHQEHVQLLHLQVKAYRDDWETERKERKKAEKGRTKAELQAAILDDQLQKATKRISELENRLKACRCSNSNGGSRIVSEYKGDITGHGFRRESLKNTNCGDSNLNCVDFESTNQDVGSLRNSGFPSSLRERRASEGNSQESHGRDTTLTEGRVNMWSSFTNVSTATFPAKPQATYKRKQTTDYHSNVGAQDYYLSKGARPKMLNLEKDQNEDEHRKLAKHKARSILASALPVSPFYLPPVSPFYLPPVSPFYLPPVSPLSSPVTPLLDSTAEIPKQYIPDATSKTIGLSQEKKVNNSSKLQNSTVDGIDKLSDTSNVCDRSIMSFAHDSLIHTENQLVTNYASISVMPSHLVASTSNSSSPFSSPGISLTTFALNASGQGVPGAIFLAIGSDVKAEKTPKIESRDSCSKGNTDLVKKEGGPESSTGRLLKSSNLLTKKKCDPSTVIPWRTARAVPSHQLNWIKRISQDERKLKVAAKGSQINYKSNNLQNISEKEHSSALLLSSFKRDESSSDSTNSSKSHFATLHGSHRGTLHFSSQSKSDLMNAACKNIASAILNYEYGQGNRTSSQTNTKSQI